MRIGGQRSQHACIVCRTRMHGVGDVAGAETVNAVSGYAIMPPSVNTVDGVCFAFCVKLAKFVMKRKMGMMGNIGCRCVRGKAVKYCWAGEDIQRMQGERVERAVARWFALVAANQEFAWGLLDLKRFDKYKDRTEAFIEEKLERAADGRLLPGTEVVPIGRAGKRPMYEFRWHRDERQLKGVKREQLRHYDAEPWQMPDCVFGMHMHLKDVRSGDDDLIAAGQDEEIDKAISLYEQLESSGWATFED